MVCALGGWPVGILAQCIGVVPADRLDPVIPDMVQSTASEPA